MIQTRCQCCNCKLPKHIHNHLMSAKYSSQTAADIACGAATLCDDLDAPIKPLWANNALTQIQPNNAIPYTPKDAEYYATIFPDLYE